MALLDVHRLRGDELGVKPGRLRTVDRGGFHQRPGPCVLIADLHPVLPIGPVRRRRHPPLGRAVLVQNRRGAFTHHVGGKGGVPEDLLRDAALRRNRTRFREGHPRRSGGRVLAQPLDRLAHRIDGRRVVRGTAPRDTGPDRTAVLVHPDAPFVDRKAVRLAHVAHAGHRHPRIGIAPAKRGVLLAIVHVAIDRSLDAHMAQIAAGKELRDILIGRPVVRHTQRIAVLGFEIGHVLGVVEPVVAEPVKVRELLVRQLVDLAVGTGDEGNPDEVVKVEVRVRHRRPLARHPVGQVARLLIAPVRPDQVRIVDVGIIDVLAGLHLGLQLLDHVAFADQVMGDLDPGDRGKGGRQDARLVFMRGDRFGNDLDLHAGIRCGGIDEPLQLGFLLLARQGRKIADLGVEKGPRSIHVGEGWPRQDQERRGTAHESKVHS